MRPRYLFELVFREVDAGFHDNAGSKVAENLAKANAPSRLFCSTRIVTVSWSSIKASLATIRKGDRLFSVPRNLEHGAEASLFRATNRPASHAVAGIDQTAIDAVVGELLGHGPVHVLKICFGKRSFLDVLGVQCLLPNAHPHWLPKDPAANRAGLGSSCWGRSAQKGVKASESNNPRRNAGGKILR